MSTDVSSNSVVRDTAPLLHVWHWLLSSACLLLPGTAWLCWHHSISLQPPPSGPHGPAHLGSWYLIGTNRPGCLKPLKDGKPSGVSSLLLVGKAGSTQSIYLQCSGWVQHSASSFEKHLSLYYFTLLSGYLSTSTQFPNLALVSF